MQKGSGASDSSQMMLSLLPVCFKPALLPCSIAWHDPIWSLCLAKCGLPFPMLHAGAGKSCVLSTCGGLPLTKGSSCQAGLEGGLVSLCEDRPPQCIHGVRCSPRLVLGHVISQPCSFSDKEDRTPPISSTVDQAKTRQDMKITSFQPAWIRCSTPQWGQPSAIFHACI